MRPDRRATDSAYTLLKTTGLPGYAPLFYMFARIFILN